MTVEKKRRFIITAVFYVIVVALLYVCIKYVIGWILPFIIAFIIASIIQRPCVWLSGKTKIKKKVWSIVLVLIIIAAIGLLTFFTASRLINECVSFVMKIPTWSQMAVPAVMDFFDSALNGVLERMSPNLDEQVNEISTQIYMSIQTELVKFSTATVQWIANTVSNLPGILIGLIVTVVATFFFATGFDKIVRFIKAQIPKKYANVISTSQHTFASTVAKMLRAYLILICLTFCELAIGLTIIGIDYSIPIAAVTAIVDILPILGTGTVLIPWAIISLILGDYYSGIGILTLYIIITVVRNTLEPRIVGKQIGLNPLVTLLCMYVGLRLLGVLGMFLLPIIILILNDAHQNGSIKIWNYVDEHENPDSQPPPGTDESGETGKEK